MNKVFAVIAAALLASAPVLAAPPEQAVIPQLLVGTLAGYAGGAAGALALSRLFTIGATGWESLARGIFGAFVGFAGGTIVGSSLGVIAVGSWLGVQGNVGLTFVGAAAGTGVAFGVGIALRIPETILPFAPPVAAAGATAGFSVGARSREREK